MEKSPEAQAEEAQEKERRDLERSAASRNYSTSPLTGKKVGQGPTNMLETKENEVTDSVFNVDYNEQVRNEDNRVKEKDLDLWARRDLDLKNIAAGRPNKVKVYVRDEGVGHLGIDIGDGEITGKYPTEKKGTNNLMPDGEIRTEKRDDFDEYKTFYVTHEQYQNMRMELNKKKMNTTGYRLLFDDCVEHTADLT
jgi:hypothetical protein